MNKIIVCTLILSLFTGCKTHKRILTNSTNQQNFTNEGEQENYWAEQLFLKDHKKQKYKTYNGVIKVIDNNIIEYDTVKMGINSCPSAYIPIFTYGLIYPSILNFTYVKGREGKVIFTISNVAEKPNLSNSTYIKRFEFLVWAPGSANPLVYFIELTNKKAIKNTNTIDFIKGAKLTFLKQAWVDI